MRNVLIRFCYCGWRLIEGSFSLGFWCCPFSRLAQVHKFYHFNAFFLLLELPILIFRTFELFHPPMLDLIVVCCASGTFCAWIHWVENEKYWRDFFNCGEWNRQNWGVNRLKCKQLGETLNNDPDFVDNRQKNSTQFLTSSRIKFNAKIHEN